jgi:hypothetical protein
MSIAKYWRYYCRQGWGTPRAPMCCSP